MIHICYVIDRLCRGGTELHLLRLIHGLDRSQFQPYLCLLDGNDEASLAMLPEHCPALRLGVRVTFRPSALPAAWRFARFLRQNRIDIVQTYMRESTCFATPVAKLAGVSHIVRTRRNLGYWMKPSDRWLGRMYGPMFSATIACGRPCCEAVIAQEHARPTSVVNIPIGVDCTRFEAVPPVDSRRDVPVRTIGMIGNLRPVKGADVFVRAAARLAESYANVRFRLAGEGDLDGIRQLAADSGLNGQLTFDGPITDIPAFLGQLDVAVLASRSEGMPNALLEYMAAGRPIVATDVGGSSELIEDGVHGFLVPSEDDEALASAVDRLLRNHSLACRMGAAARQRANRQYPSEVEVCAFEDLYLRLVSERRRRHGSLAQSTPPAHWPL